MARGPVGASVRRALLGMEEDEEGEALRFCARILDGGRLLLRLLRDAEGPVGGCTLDRALWSRPPPAPVRRELLG